MQALVLVGGEGTRLRPLTLTQPKPAVTLVDRPLIRFMVDWLGRHRIDEVVMACGFRAEDLRAALGDQIVGGPRIRYMEEEEPLGTAGPVRLAADMDLLGERFMVLNGDVLSDIDLTILQRQHAESAATITLALHPVADPGSYGLVRREPSGEVLGFLEKPEPGEIDTDEISAGAYVLERSALELIPAGRAVSIEREVFPRLVGRGLYGRRLEGYWIDIGAPERYLRASWDILEGRVESEVEAGGDGLALAGSTEINPKARLSAPTLLGPGVTVAAGAEIGPRAIVRDGSRIATDASVVESVLLDGCRVEAGARVCGSILAAGVEVGAGAAIDSGAVIGRGARITAGASVAADARVQPGEVVDAEPAPA
jgi:mannose-1-phosphate guanylyltransferase